MSLADKKISWLDCVVSSMERINTRKTNTNIVKKQSFRGVL